MIRGGTRLGGSKTKLSLNLFPTPLCLCRVTQEAAGGRVIRGGASAGGSQGDLGRSGVSRMFQQAMPR